MVHKGKLLEEKIRKSGKSIQDLCKQLDISRTTMYRWFTIPDLNPKYLRQVGELIGETFSEDPDVAMEVREEIVQYIASDARCYELLKERNKYLEMYHKAQQDLNRKNDELLSLYKENSNLNRKINELLAARK
ncbi:helix-turn-helix domain-containing protein [bacterium]|nr:helix-turn-helix domain-containing protein [bacterium]